MPGGFSGSSHTWMNKAGLRRTSSMVCSSSGPVEMIASTRRPSAAWINSAVRRVETPVSPSITFSPAADSSEAIASIVSLNMESTRCGISTATIFDLFEASPPASRFGI